MFLQEAIKTPLSWEGHAVISHFLVEDTMEDKDEPCKELHPEESEEPTSKTSSMDTSCMSTPPCIEKEQGVNKEGVVTKKVHEITKKVQEGVKKGQEGMTKVQKQSNITTKDVVA